MSEERKALHNVIDIMPDEWVKKMLIFIEDLKKQNEKDIPDRLTAKDEEDLVNKLSEAINDKESIPLSEVVKKMNQIIAE